MNIISALGGISFVKKLAGSLGVVAVLPCPPAAAVPGRDAVAVAAGVSCAKNKKKLCSMTCGRVLQ